MTVVDKTFQPDIEILKTKLRHWFRFDSLQPEQGIALLIGVDPIEASELVNWYKSAEGDEDRVYRVLELLDGEVIEVEIQRFDDETNKAKNRMGQLARTHRYFLEYWRSGDHPERPPPAYFVEWAKLKGINPSWTAVAVELQLIPGEILVKASLNATSASPENPMKTTEGAVSVTLPHISKKLAAVFQIMRDNWTDYDPKRLPKQANIAREIDEALGWKEESDGSPSRSAKTVAMLIKPDAIDGTE